MDVSEVESRIDRAVEAIGTLRLLAERIAGAQDGLREAVGSGGKVLTFGNGGSAAHAMHLAEELVGKYRALCRPFPAVCLNADPTALTCIANDFGFEEVFARQVRALAGPGDVVVGISTSGNSPNVLAGLRAARAAGARAIGLLGRDGGAALELCDVSVVVPMKEAETVQEAHQVLVHLLVEAVEEVA